MIGIIIGIIMILLAAVAVILCVIKTPQNLRGFYGKMFISIASVAVAGGIAIIVLGALQII